MADNGRVSKYLHLDQHKIPHEITLTDSCVKWLMRIAEVKPFLDEHLGTPLEVQLLRRAKVRAITYSNQIEGNTLGEGDVTAVLNGKKIKGSPKDVKEVQNYHLALEYAEKLASDKRSLRIADFCDLQKLVTSDLLPKDQCGQIRTIPVSIINAATGDKIDDCPQPHALRDLLDDLWRWVSDTDGMNPYARAFAFHFIAVAIHPFVDGNGRTVRLMQHLLLLRQEAKIARFVPSETAIMRNRDRYYSSIRQSKALSSLHPILEFLAECFATAAEEVAKEGRTLLRSGADKKPDIRHKRIINLGKQSETFSIQQVIQMMPDVPRRTLERDLETLTKMKALMAIGDKKARKYGLPNASPLSRKRNKK